MQQFLKNAGIIFSLALVVLSSDAQKKQPVDYADPLMGTSESRWMLNPGTSLPFAMVQLSPDNQGNQWNQVMNTTLPALQDLAIFTLGRWRGYP